MGQVRARLACGWYGLDTLVRIRPRQGLAFVLSVALHLGVLLWGSFTLGSQFEIPEFELEFAEVELVDPDQLQGEAPSVPPPPPPVVAAGPTLKDPNASGEAGDDGKQDQPKRDFGSKSSKVDELGPTNATYFMMLANKKVAPLPFADSAVEIMAPLPDFELIIQNGGFHALRDFDYIVIASSDIRDATQTFLAVQHKIPVEQLKAGLVRAAEHDDELLQWEQRNGLTMGNPRPRDPDRPDLDPRWFVLIDQDTAVYVRDEFLPHIIAGPDERKGKTAGNFVANLAKLRTFAAREPRAGLQLVMKDLEAALEHGKLPFGAPIPEDIEVMAEAAKEPELMVRLRFSLPEEANRLASVWREDIRKVVDNDLRAKLMVGWLYEQIEIMVDGNVVTLRSAFSEEQARTILDMLADLSRRMLQKTPDEMDEAKQRREQAWRERMDAKPHRSSTPVRTPPPTDAPRPEPLPSLSRSP